MAEIKGVVWKPVVGYEGIYEVSNMGDLKSLCRKGRVKQLILKPYYTRKGYLRCILRKDGKPKQKLVHRLVAESFIDNPLNKTQVNHIDEVKDNNAASNLEWCTNQENCNHGTSTERQRQKVINGNGSIKVAQYDLENNLIKVWPSMSEAGRNGFNQQCISFCCSGIQKTHNNSIWIKLKE